MVRVSAHVPAARFAAEVARFAVSVVPFLSILQYMIVLAIEAPTEVLPPISPRVYVPAVVLVASSCRYNPAAHDAFDANEFDKPHTTSLAPFDQVVPVVSKSWTKSPKYPAPQPLQRKRSSFRAIPAKVAVTVDSV